MLLRPLVPIVIAAVVVVADVIIAYRVSLQGLRRLDILPRIPVGKTVPEIAGDIEPVSGGLVRHEGLLIGPEDIRIEGMDRRSLSVGLHDLGLLLLRGVSRLFEMLEILYIGDPVVVIGVATDDAPSFGKVLADVIPAAVSSADPEQYASVSVVVTVEGEALGIVLPRRGQIESVPARSKFIVIIIEIAPAILVGEGRLNVDGEMDPLSEEVLFHPEFRDKVGPILVFDPALAVHGDVNRLAGYDPLVVLVPLDICGIIAHVPGDRVSSFDEPSDGDGPLFIGVEKVRIEHAVALLAGHVPVRSAVGLVAPQLRDRSVGQDPGQHDVGGLFSALFLEGIAVGDLIGDDHPDGYLDVDGLLVVLIRGQDPFFLFHVLGPEKDAAAALPSACLVAEGVASVVVVARGEPVLPGSRPVRIVCFAPDHLPHPREGQVGNVPGGPLGRIDGLIVIESFVYGEPEIQGLVRADLVGERLGLDVHGEGDEIQADVGLGDVLIDEQSAPRIDSHVPGDHVPGKLRLKTGELFCMIRVAVEGPAQQITVSGLGEELAVGSGELQDGVHVLSGPDHLSRGHGSDPDAAVLSGSFEARLHVYREEGLLPVVGPGAPAHGHRKLHRVDVVGKGLKYKARSGLDIGRPAGSQVEIDDASVGRHRDVEPEQSGALVRVVLILIGGIDLPEGGRLGAGFVHEELHGEDASVGHWAAYGGGDLFGELHRAAAVSLDLRDRGLNAHQRHVVGLRPVHGDHAYGKQGGPHVQRIGPGIVGEHGLRVAGGVRRHGILCFGQLSQMIDRSVVDPFAVQGHGSPVDPDVGTVVGKGEIAEPVSAGRHDGERREGGLAEGGLLLLRQA